VRVDEHDRLYIEECEWTDAPSVSYITSSLNIMAWHAVMRHAVEDYCKQVSA